MLVSAMYVPWVHVKLWRGEMWRWEFLLFYLCLSTFAVIWTPLYHFPFPSPPSTLLPPLGSLLKKI